MRSRIAWSLALSTLVSFLAVACGDEDETPPESPDPVVGVMSLPISHRNSAEEPANPVRVEISGTKLRVDGSTILELTAGKVPAAEQTDFKVPKLAQALSAGAARRAATIRLDGTTPWATTLLVLNTLKGNNIHDVAFAVRAPGGTEIHYLHLGPFEVVQPSEEYQLIAGSAQRNWDEFKAKWQEMYTACRAGAYVDCAYVPQNIAEGGRLHLTLFARGDAMKVEMHRFGIEDEEEGGGPQLLEGIAPDPVAVPEEQLPPATTAAFTFRAREATAEESAISTTIRPLCGSAECGATVVAEGLTQTMRLISFIGAVYPNGVPAPTLRFQLNPDEPL